MRDAGAEPAGAVAARLTDADGDVRADAVRKLGTMGGAGAEYAGKVAALLTAPLRSLRVAGGRRHALFINRLPSRERGPANSVMYGGRFLCSLRPSSTTWPRKYRM